MLQRQTKQCVKLQRCMLALTGDTLYMNHFMKEKGITNINGQSRLEAGTQVELKSGGGGGCKRKIKEVMDDKIDVGGCKF